MRKKLTAEEERREAELAALSDPAAQAARRLREAEAWRQEQERKAQGGGGNANLQPLGTDWRERVKAAKAAEGRK